jgi:hypothetical protein
MKIVLILLQADDLAHLLNLAPGYNYRLVQNDWPREHKSEEDVMLLQQTPVE